MVGRNGPFPFLSLPLEIRRRVYRLLLAPFYKTQSSMPLTDSKLCKQPFIEIKVIFWDQRRDYDDEYIGGFEHYLVVNEMNGTALDLKGQSEDGKGHIAPRPEDRMKLEANFTKERGAYFLEIGSPPNRNTLYQMTTRCIPYMVKEGTSRS